MKTLIEFRKSMSLTQKEMAKKIGCSLSWYQKIESKKKMPGRVFIDRLRHEFPKVNIKSIFFD